MRVGDTLQRLQAAQTAEEERAEREGRSRSPQRVFLCSSKPREEQKSERVGGARDGMVSPGKGGHGGLTKILQNCVGASKAKRKAPANLDSLTLSALRKKAKDKVADRREKEKEREREGVELSKLLRSNATPGAKTKKKRRTADTSETTMDPSKLNQRLISAKKHMQKQGGRREKEKEGGELQAKTSKSRTASFFGDSKSSFRRDPRAGPTHRMSLYDILEHSAVVIQKNVRGFLCRLHLARFLQSVIQAGDVHLLGREDETGTDTRGRRQGAGLGAPSEVVSISPHPSELLPLKRKTSGQSDSSSLRGTPVQRGRLQTPMQLQQNGSSRKEREREREKEKSLSQNSLPKVVIRNDVAMLHQQSNGGKTEVRKGGRGVETEGGRPTEKRGARPVMADFGVQVVTETPKKRARGAGKVMASAYVQTSGREERQGQQVRGAMVGVGVGGGRGVGRREQGTQMERREVMNTVSTQMSNRTPFEAPITSSPTAAVHRIAQPTAESQSAFKTPKYSDESHNSNKLLAPNSSRVKLEAFAKEQYQKWSQVDQLLSRMQRHLNYEVTNDVSDFFRKVEELAIQNKTNLRRDFGWAESIASLHRSPTVKSEETELVRPPNTVGFRTRAAAHNILQPGQSHSPVGSPLLKVPVSFEKWVEPINDVYNNKMSHASEKRAPHEPGLFESIDEKIDKLIRKEQRRKSSSLRWSGRDDPELSESVLRSIVFDKDAPREHPHPLAPDSSQKELLNRPQYTKESLEKISKSVIEAALSPNMAQPLSPASVLHPQHLPQFDYLNPSTLPASDRDKLVSSPPTLIPPMLQKTKSKKSIPLLQPLALPPLAPLFPHPCSTIESAQKVLSARANSEPENSTPSLQEINNNLQSILDDLGTSTPIDLLLMDSSRRDKGDSGLWDYETFLSVDRQKLQVIENITDVILGKIVTEVVVQDFLWREELMSIFSNKLAPKSKIKPKPETIDDDITLNDKFKEIDDLLHYEESPKSLQLKKEKEPSSKNATISKPAAASTTQNPQPPPTEKMADALDEGYGAEDDQEQSETVYGIRTNFNAVNEYLNLLLKFLREKLPELNLPVHKDSASLVLRKVHLLELELKENQENNIPVKSITIPKRLGRKEARSGLKSYQRPAIQGSPLSENLFLVLEEEILVSFV
jgi:hypothetical protein